MSTSEAHLLPNEPLDPSLARNVVSRLSARVKEVVYLGPVKRDGETQVGAIAVAAETIQDFTDLFVILLSADAAFEEVLRLRHENADLLGECERTAQALKDWRDAEHDRGIEMDLNT